mgnify:FL=1
MKIFKLFILLSVFFMANLKAASPHFIDFKYVLNESIAGKKAQEDLKSQLEKGIAKLNKDEKKLLEEEKKIIQQKKIINPDEYKKKVDELRSKVSKLQKERQSLLNNVAKQRSKARTELLKNLNPILEKYMKEKNINMIVDKKNLIVAANELNITPNIINLLNEKIKSLNYK